MIKSRREVIKTRRLFENGELKIENLERRNKREREEAKRTAKSAFVNH